jgi:LysR family transcriptional regulator, glycine cleavage system transcriptional activator
VRISASYKLVALERSLVDVAVRLCRAEDAPEGSICLFGEQLFPICSPALVLQGPHPLRSPADLAHHTLLHMDGAGGYFDWSTWLAAEGFADLRPAASLRFDGYDQMISAALSGQGVAMGISHLVRGLVAEGRLVAPFPHSVEGSRAYYVVHSQTTGTRPHVKAFMDWLVGEAHAATHPATLSSRPPAAPSGAAARRARSGR